jgi:hypothetical protein
MLFPRLPAALLAVATLVVSASPTIAADPPPPGPRVGSAFACIRPGVDPPRCTSVGDGYRHHVAFDASLTDALRTAMRDTMADDYDPTDLILIEDERVTRLTDVIALAGDYGENGAAGWVYCPADAPQGTNPVGDRWCRNQELHFNLNARYVSYLGDDGSRAYVACHELGHTVGLSHWGNPPESSGPPAATCMQADVADGPTNLDPADVARIDAYPYPLRRPGRHVLLAGASGVLPFGAGGVQALEIERVATLSALVSGSDAVVRGRVAAVAPGRMFGSLHYAELSLEVAALLAGRLQTSTGLALTLEVPLFAGPGAIATLRDRVGLEGIFFLRNKGASAAAAGLPPATQAAEARFYRLMTFDALVSDESGTARASSERAYLADLDGRSIAEVIATIRAAVPAEVEPLAPGSYPVRAVRALRQAEGVVPARR